MGKRGLVKPETANYSNLERLASQVSFVASSFKGERVEFSTVIPLISFLRRINFTLYDCGHRSSNI